MSDHEEFDELAWTADRARLRRRLARRRRRRAGCCRPTSATPPRRTNASAERPIAMATWTSGNSVSTIVPSCWACHRRRRQGERETAAAQRGQATVSRDGAHEERQRHAVDRDGAAVAHADTATQREGATPTTQLALAFAEIARHLYQAEDFDDVLTRIVFVAVSTVRGCEMASVTVRDDAGYRTVASTHAAASESDRAQYEAGEGPCLDAVEDAVVYTPAFPDPLAGPRRAPHRFRRRVGGLLSLGPVKPSPSWFPLRIAQRLCRHAGRLRRRSTGDRVDPGRARLCGRRSDA